MKRGRPPTRKIAESKTKSPEMFDDASSSTTLKPQTESEPVQIAKRIIRSQSLTVSDQTSDSAQKPKKINRRGQRDENRTIGNGSTEEKR
jgi:hypothetical protein